MRRTREQRKQQTRGDLVTAARAAFLNSGFHRASLDEICEEAGYTTGAVYSNFSGKDGLFLAVFDERLDERMRASVEIALDAPDFEASARRTARDMIEAMRAIDGPDIEAIVQFGANLPMARLADEAERWLDKPVISVNVATYWHACRMNGIDDKLYGFTQLFSRF